MNKKEAINKLLSVILDDKDNVKYEKVSVINPDDEIVVLSQYIKGIKQPNLINVRESTANIMLSKHYMDRYYKREVGTDYQSDWKDSYLSKEEFEIDKARKLKQFEEHKKQVLDELERVEKERITDKIQEIESKLDFVEAEKEVKKKVKKEVKKKVKKEVKEKSELEKKLDKAKEVK